MSSSRRVVTTNSERKNLDEAMDYVTKGWLPISPKVINLVREKLKQGQYESQREDLIEDLKKDFSLFTWFLSKLGELQKQIDEAKALTSLDDIVREIEIQKLVEVFQEPDAQQSARKRESALKPQTLALKQAVVAATTAESAAQTKRLDPTLAHMCAGVRQLGINLVAWNYPRIYGRALEHSQSGKEPLDQALEKILGYSPLELATQLALKWDQTGGLAAFVQNDTGKLSTLEPAAQALLGANPSELFKCIELGESVSRLAAPELYPNSVSALPSIIANVEGVFGKDGLDRLRQTLKQTSAAYVGENGEPFSLDIDPKRVTDVARTQIAEKLVVENSWVGKCPSSFQEKFKQLYCHIDRQAVSPTAINILVGEVIPALGFTRGCVYLVENTKMRLNAVMRIGDAPLSRYKALDCSASEKSSHPVVVAMGYSAPVVQENVPVYGEFVSHVTGVFGNQAKSGVLYLEMSEKLSRSADRSEALLFFKAVRQALVDCLNLK